MFVSTNTNNIDAKGRISVPADFRAAINTSEFDGIVVWKSLHNSCLEGGSLRLLDGFLRALDEAGEYDPGREALLISIVAGSAKLSFDSTGRVTIPKEFCEYAGFSDRATFVGLGRRFEIWEPEAHLARVEGARQLALRHTHLLRPKLSAPTSGAPHV